LGGDEPATLLQRSRSCKAAIPWVTCRWLEKRRTAVGLNKAGRKIAGVIGAKRGLRAAPGGWLRAV
jgi:hypothetical protein